MNSIFHKIFRGVESFLNSITMYRLALYYLTLLLLFSFFLSFFNIFEFSPIEFIVSASIILLLSVFSNTIFARILGIPKNVESVYISSFILTLIIQPVPFNEYGLDSLAITAPVIAMASKYFIAFSRKHIFNPAAFGVLASSLIFSQYPSWWVGEAAMFPVVFIGGLLVVRKVRRGDLVISFFVLYAVLLSLYSFAIAGGGFRDFWQSLFYSPIAFFVFIMLTEPMTTPSTRQGRVFYGLIIAILLFPPIHIGAYYFSIESALLVGNIFSYLISPKGKFIMTLRRKIEHAGNICDFWFIPDRNFSFLPGQYLEWTLSHDSPDNRGFRRYFTIASSPSEEEIALGVKFYDQPSTFKKKLISLKLGDKIIAGGVSGDFILPKDASKKLVFIAGGIGITPFRSIIQDLLIKKEKRPIILFYSIKTSQEAVYRDIFDKAEREINLRVIYTVTDAPLPPSWAGKHGFIDKKMIEKEVGDYRDAIFFISGPHSMVSMFESVLKEMNVKRKNIKVDFFPGYA